MSKKRNRTKNRTIVQDGHKVKTSGNGHKVGAAMVVGGGICGMQSALDLANSGFKVYLMDKNPSIGAEVARLDKTFLSNESAMRILAPRLLEISGNGDIEILTNAEVEALEGEAGHFARRSKCVRDT